MTRNQRELKEVQKTVKKLKRLYGMVVEKYLTMLEGDVNASLLSEVGKFLYQNNVNLQSMIKLEIIESMKEMDSRIRGDLDSIGVNEEDNWKRQATDSLEGFDFSDIPNSERKTENGYSEQPYFKEQLQ